ncbi:zinc ABC transporter ATP-binding protein [Prevotella herbatica]|uniref:Zinc ABC transporter ATP-binding protein n=1 Tax=Prevotella herbatica TaxID=2801997 RepID=A0ABM7NZI2_9BACT|nr:ABC transporter ATP-binding protein [Prevotella herbatica]BCS85880.1 zinc ABC transporter ATP-binding protein [Prevotella herbatica]
MSNTIIDIKNITAKYSQKIALENVSLKVLDDDYLGIIGPNGGGKTTLMKIILGMMKPDSGSVTFYRDGKKTDNINIGYLPQYTDIDRKFPISVYDVILSGLKKKLFKKYTEEQLNQVQQTIIDMELEELQHNHIGALSGGQLQRVLLARAIVSNPEVLILDEPNTYIDKRFQEQMYEMLNEINKYCAIIIVSHDIAEIMNNVKHIACVNKSLHYHADKNMPMQKLEEHFLRI